MWSQDGSFTCTLFLPSKEYQHLETQPESAVPKFFEHHFPGVLDLIPDTELIRSFKENPHLPLVSIKCRPYHFGASGVIIGDAAHAMVPFYGQGMNAGLEDVRILFQILDKYTLDGTKSQSDLADVADTESQRDLALAEYSLVRTPDAHAINDLALGNYIEMRSSVLSRRYRLRKFLEEFMSAKFPKLGWQTKYARVSFSNEGYREIIQQSERQGVVLGRILSGLIISPIVIGGVILFIKYNKRI